MSERQKANAREIFNEQTTCVQSIVLYNYLIEFSNRNYKKDRIILMANNQKIVLVTGGSGLVGSAIKSLIDEEKPKNEEYIFLTSKDADLT